LALIEQLQDCLRSDIDTLQPLVASSAVNKYVVSGLVQRVESLEREAKSPSKEAILAEENEQLRRNIAILEYNLANQARTLKTVQESSTQLYNQLVQANVKIASLQGGRV
jgi:hypothetical protein